MLNPSPETYHSLLSLRTVRRFRQEPVSEADRSAILEAGRWTGSGKNIQPWVFVVMTDRDRIAELAGCGDFSQPLLGAPLVIAPVRLPSGYDWDMGRVAQNMMLAAAALGVGSCPITLHREDCGRRVLAIPDDHRCQIVIALGYPDATAEAQGRAAFPMGGRKAVADLVKYEHF
jgi:nitroreductase